MNINVEVRLMRSIALVCVLFFLAISIQAQDEGLPDKIALKPMGKGMAVKIAREDCNFVYYLIVKGGTETKAEWTRVIDITYDESCQATQIAEQTFEGDTPNYVSALASYEKVLKDANAKAWEVAKANYRIALCHINMGAPDKAKEKLLAIKTDSRWYFPSKLILIDTLKEEEKIPAIIVLLKGTEGTPAFKIDLSFKLVDRYLSDNKGNEAKQAFEDLKKLATSPDKNMTIQLDECQLKVDIMNKNYGEAEKKINQYVSAGNETGLMRVSLGDILVSKGQENLAIYEYLRGRLDFKEVSAEAGYKGGKLFFEMWQKDKINFADYRKYALKELKISYSAGENSIWSTKAKRLSDQINK